MAMISASRTRPVQTVRQQHTTSRNSNKSTGQGDRTSQDFNNKLTTYHEAEEELKRDDEEIASPRDIAATTHVNKPLRVSSSDRTRYGDRETSTKNDARRRQVTTAYGSQTQGKTGREGAVGGGVLSLRE
ncbi:hypothetical protein RRG08_003625 [Elysia crispata]|uniref:Uncharacterized protein n=1 Tax=Elysia crispata TaxID=231223 RepID=A0AAE1AX55_9GAST|nr:hypothetical protein RRG08_003625 [Elysia crispata]